MQRTPALLPDARSRAQLAWDPNRRRLMLWGGYPAPTPGVVFDPRVWEFDGTDWSARTLATAPAGRSRHGMVQVRGGLRIFGGAGSPALPALPWEIWDYDGARFTARHGDVLSRTIAAHDVVRHTTIALAEVLGSTTLRTLEWRDSALRELSVAPPPRRSDAQLVGGPLGGVLRIGGRDPVGSGTIDVWSFDGGAWRQLATNAPPARSGFALALDPQRGRVVLFGGFDPVAGLLADTWEFDGATWQQVPVAGPAARTGAAMAFDRTAGPGVLLCGGSAGLVDLDDTWRFDGVTWDRTAATLPTPVARTVRLAHWPERQQAILVRSLPGGGQDAFVFGGSAWQSFPAPTTFGALAGDERGRVVSLGADVEMLSMFPAVAAAAPGCSNANTPARLVTHRLPRLGETAPVELIGATPRSVAFLALNADGRGMWTAAACFVLDRPVLHAVVVTDAVGNAPLPLSFPADPALLFADIGAQVVVPEPAGPLFGSFALSQMLRLRAGD